MGGNLSADPASLIFHDLASYTDLAFYYKNGVEASTGNWSDQSGNNNHMVQTSVGSQGIKLLGGINMNGVDQYYSLTSAVDVTGEAPFAMFCALTNLDYTTPNSLLSKHGTLETIELTSDRLIKIQQSDTAATTLSGAPNTFPTKTYMVICITKDAQRRYTVYKDGALLSLDPANNPPLSSSSSIFTHVGAGHDVENIINYFGGTILELGLYERELSQLEIDTVNSYLVNKLL